MAAEAGVRSGDCRVVIPWASTNPDPHRVAALDWVTARWQALGYATTLGIYSAKPWRKATAIEAGLSGGDEPIIAVVDADVWTEGFTDAIARVRAGAPYVIPHNQLHRLSRDATGTVLGGTAPHPNLPLDDFTPDVPGFIYPGLVGGGAVILRRDVYEKVPLDPRFGGWGQEDESWALALACLYGPPVRLPHRLYHLWHPPQPRLDRGIGSEASLALYRRYAKARHRPDAMRALIREGKEAAC